VVVSTGRESGQPIDELRTELRMLTEALLERVEPWLLAGLSEPSSAAAATEGRWCPICAAAAAPRGEHPELPQWVIEQRGGLAQGRSRDARPTPPDVPPHPQRDHGHGRGTIRAARPTHPRPHRRGHAVIHQHLPATG